MLTKAAPLVIMNKNQRRWLGWIVGIAVLAVIVALLYKSPSWKNFEWRRLGFLLSHVHLGWFALAVLGSYGSYALRAWRWRFFVNPLKRCSLWTLFEGQIFGFSSIYLIGRAGEIVRPAYIAKTEQLPFTSQVAVWLLERIYDTLALVGLFALAIDLQPTRYSAARLGRAHRVAIIILIFAAVLIVLMVLFRVYSERILPRLEVALGFLPTKWEKWIAALVRSFSTGLEVVQDPRDLAASIVSTVALWVLNVSVMWMSLRCLGGSLAVLSWWAATLTLVIASLGLVIQLPGIGGGFQVAILLALKELFRAPPSAAASAAIVTWMTMMLPCFILGTVLLFYKGLSFEMLRASAEHQRHAAAHKT